MKHSYLYIGSLFGVLVGVLLASFLTLFRVDTIELQKSEIGMSAPQGSLLKPFHITQDMLNKLRGIDTKTEKTNMLGDWKLIATYVSRKPAAMLAKGNEVSVLSLEQELEGHKLKKVKDMSVEFTDNGGKKVELFMDVAYEGKPQEQVAFSDTNTAAEQEYKMTQGSIDRYLKQPEELLKTVKIMPKMNGAVFEGVEISGLTQYSFLYNFGVRKGDILTEINGKKLNSVADALSEYQKILNMREFEVKVKRDNSEKVLKYEVVN